MISEEEALKLIKSKLTKSGSSGSRADFDNIAEDSGNISGTIANDQDYDPGADFEIALGDEEIAKLMTKRRNLGDDHFKKEYERIRNLPENVGRDINVTFTPYGTPIIVDRAESEKKLLSRGSKKDEPLESVNAGETGPTGQFSIVDKNRGRETSNVQDNNVGGGDSMSEIRDHIENHYRIIAPNLYKYIKMLEAAVFK